MSKIKTIEDLIEGASKFETEDGGHFIPVQGVRLIMHMLVDSCPISWTPSDNPYEYEQSESEYYEEGYSDCADDINKWKKQVKNG